jgi:16S rRNA (guanine527-N7)-methyltransferase
MADHSYTAQDFANRDDVSRETFEDFQKYEALLTKWNRKINLVSPKAAQNFWGRHALDSWQITQYMTDAHHECLDLGSGAGFPGIAAAIYLKQRGQGSVTLVESAGKKASFLRTVIRELGLPAKVWADRAEKLAPHAYDLITARAFAPLPRLLTYAHPFWGEGTTALLLKGERVEEELTQSAQMWIYEAAQHVSISDSTGVVLQINALRPKADASAVHS